jgi:hypothetical protein
MKYVLHPSVATSQTSPFAFSNSSAVSNTAYSALAEVSPIAITQRVRSVFLIFMFFNFYNINDLHKHKRKKQKRVTKK